LALGAPDILAVALAAGYGSHEAFTRAFRERFGLTPEALRAQGHTHCIPLQEAIRMDRATPVDLAAPRWVTAPVRHLVGLSARLDCADSAGIPGLWQRFGPYLGHIPGQSGRAAYGVIANGDDGGNMDYTCAVEASELAAVPAGLSRLTLGAQRYVVFTHPGHVSGLRGTFVTVLNEWLPNSGHGMAPAPLLERYGPGFDALTGWGDIEVWIPLAA